MHQPILAGICLLAASQQSFAAEPTLCARDETVFFNCRVAKSGKLISLCGDAGAEKFLQYKFGRPGSVELTFPKARKDSLSQFTWSQDYRKSVDSLAYKISFSIASYTCVVSATSPTENLQALTGHLTFE